jgi:uncharacterized protein (TIGR02118 family)
MYKFVALYKRPEDIEAFEKHYAEVHVPLVTKTPGIGSINLTRFKASAMGGEPAYYMMTEISFFDKDTFKAAAKSPEWSAAGKDIMSFAASIVTLIVGEG